jgi:glycosyltransferase involved in cell wall biosynthesis
VTKFALVSHTLPPASSGQGVALYRLLRNLPADSYCLISQRKFCDDLTNVVEKQASAEFTHVKPVAIRDLKKSTDYLPVHYYHCPQLKQVKRGASWLARLRILQAINFPVGLRTLPDYVDAIEAVLKIENCDAVIGCSGSLWDIPAAFAAAKRLGIRFYAHYFDWWMYQFYWYKEISFAKAKENEILKNAAGVFVPNESLASELKQRYGIEPIIIRNPCEFNTETNELIKTTESISINRSDATGGFSDNNLTTSKQTIRILYTGAIYGAQSDAVKNLLSALDLIDDCDIKLIVYTTVSHNILKLKGIKGKIEIYGHIPNNEIRLAQQHADLLFLPLSFKTHYNKEVITTAAPSKMSDYLASERPILVHAPADSFVAQFFSENECGLVVSKREPVTLANELKKLLRDGARCTRYSQNAMYLAKKEFDSKVVSDKLFRAISIEA